MSDHIQALAEHLGKVFHSAAGYDSRDGFMAIARAVYQLKCEVVGPDGLALLPEPHENLQEAVRFTAAWVQRYVGPGYYVDTRRNRIPVEELGDHLEFRFVFTEPEEEQ